MITGEFVDNFVRFVKEWGEVLSAVSGGSIVAIVTWLRSRAALRRRQYALQDDRKALGLDYGVIFQHAMNTGLLDADPSRSLKTIYTEQYQLVFATLLEWQKRVALHEQSRLVSGSLSFRFGDIIKKSSSLCIPLRLRCPSLNVTTTIGFLKLFDQPISSLVDRPVAIVGDAGFGKTFLCHNVLAHVVAEHSDRIVIIIRPDDIETISKSSHSFLSLYAVADWLAEQVFADATLPIHIHIIRSLLAEQALVMVDGLDEIVPRIPDTFRSRAYNSWLLKNAHVITTRFWHYQHLRDHTDIFSHRHTIVIDRLTVADCDSFLRAALKLITPMHAERAFTACRTALEGLSSSFPSTPSLPVATSTGPPAVAGATPLLLLMLVELSQVFLKGGDLSYAVDIYGHFTSRILRQELARHDATVDELAARHFLQDLAWKMFASGKDDRQATFTALSDSEVNALTSEHSESVPGLTQFAQRIVADSALLQKRLHSSISVEFVTFTHQSFLEYLISERVRDWILGNRQGGDDFIDQLETPQITVFIKEFIDKIAQVPVFRDQAVRTLASQLQIDIQARNAATTELDRRKYTFRIGQIVYHYAMFRRMPDDLINLALQDSSLWVRQAAAIGMAFGGNPNPLHSYIDQLRLDVRNGNFVNVGAHIATQLSFYGDQEFDLLDPTRDLGGMSCRKFVTRVVHELWLSAEAANWRVNLFDLLFLSRYRPSAQASFAEALTEVRDSLSAVLPLIRGRYGDTYPEIRELETVLAEGKWNGF